MIFVTQGHENGIGLEVFLKSFTCLNSKNKKKFKLFCHKNTLDKTLLNINLEIPNELSIEYVSNDELSQTLNCIESAVSNISSNDILLTLPSSKDQFIFNNKALSGHTEYFRNKYNNNHISMSFISKDMITTLLSDHIPVSKISDYITVELITSKISLTIDILTQIKNIDEVIFSGINPHCGEDGLMGDEDLRITKAIDILKSKYKDITFIGPLPGDTMHFNHKNSKQLLVYSFHDQGLTIFKQYNGLTGINTSFGLPFLRVSPDHGTAFNLAGKNEASYLGMNYLLNEILNWKA